MGAMLETDVVAVDCADQDAPSLDGSSSQEALPQSAAEAQEDGATEGTEVFVGGLPSDATDEAVAAAFASVGKVLSVRLTRRKRGGECKGFGFVKYGDQGTAERACAEVKEACGKPVGVHISRGRAVDEAFESNGDWPLHEDPDPDASINKLLHLLRSHTDKRSAVEAALRAVHNVPNSQASTEEGDARTRAARPRLEVDVPDPATLIDAFPHCKRLLDTFRASPNTQNKTPLAILHEYATRFTLELVYDEKSDSALGPFTSEAKLTSVGGAVLYAKGTGRGRGKKDAKQVAAAALLEELLKSVDMSEFLQPGKSKQQLPIRLALHPGLLHMQRGRGGRRGGTRGGYMRALSRGYYPQGDYIHGPYGPPHYADIAHHADPRSGYSMGLNHGYDGLPLNPHHPQAPPLHRDPLASIPMGGRSIAPELLHHAGLQDARLHEPSPSSFPLPDTSMHLHQQDHNSFEEFQSDYGTSEGAAARQLGSLPVSTRSYPPHHLASAPGSSSIINMGLTSPLTAGNGLGPHYSQFQQF